jgi:hypothetical protein
LVLSGCAGQVTRLTPDAQVQRAPSARVTFDVRPALAMRISRASYGTYSAPKIGQDDIAWAERDVAELLRETRSQATSAIDSALRSNGIPSGDDVLIRLRVEEAIHTGLGPGAVVSVTAYFKAAPVDSVPWSIQIRAMTSMVDNPKTTAAKFASKAVDELVAAGIIARAR